MKQFIAFFLLFGLFISLFPSQLVLANDAPLAKKGVLHVGDYNKESLKLSGEWEFYWKELLEPVDFLDKTERHYLKVPSQWNESKGLSILGYATYRLILHIPNESIGKNKAIAMPSSASSAKIWIDGRLIKTEGKVGTSEETSAPSTNTSILFFTPKSNEVEIVIQVSSFSQRKGGLWTNLEYGERDYIISNKVNSFLVSGFLIGSLVIISIYHFVMYVNRRTSNGVYEIL